jgi:hypothetical protein
MRWGPTRHTCRPHMMLMQPYAGLFLRRWHCRGTPGAGALPHRYIGLQLRVETAGSHPICTCKLWKTTQPSAMLVQRELVTHSASWQTTSLPAADGMAYRLAQYLTCPSGIILSAVNSITRSWEESRPVVCRLMVTMGRGRGLSPAAGATTQEHAQLHKCPHNSSGYHTSSICPQ